MKVLVIDDNEDITFLLSKYLSSKGLNVTSTSDPQEGFRKIIDQIYDVILLDISMPELSGIDIIHQLEERGNLKQQKIIIFSAAAFTTKEVESLLKKEGVCGCMKKPVQLNKLLNVISC